jgi:hypothetical protein
VTVGGDSDPLHQQKDADDAARSDSQFGDGHAIELQNAEVSRWADRSLNAMDATQVTAGLRPIDD